ncbi:hypothetical protein SAMN02745248_02479 [Hathewaya proteolytica DSM 3090]|uniref:Uncharacterized protein n=1 Tax=Hathewaya proteolytica DSM 3090 TaxID=1121331 RepID=A0A1M6S8P1_9CLOT|nr:hypothetical protein [Hathewaya proteolytica]SHK41070.1 hypothetical protein SAMN02745248_02479 [Hathewaya proteolytica DSM 3090]
MNLSKAIKKQRSNFILFLVFMSFTFLLLPTVLLFLNNFKIILWIYLALVEIVIVSGVIKRIDLEILSYKNNIGKFRMRQGIFDKKISFRCEDVVFVDVEKGGQQWDIVMIFQTQRYNKYLRNISKSAMKKHPYAASYYYKIHESKPEFYYYYLVINKGLYKKYGFLNEIYSSCFHAFYSDDAINLIRQWR